MKNKEKSRNCHILEDTKVTWRQMHCGILGYILEQQQQNNGKTGEIQIKPVMYLIVLYQYQFPGFEHYAVVWLYKMLSVGKAG